MENINFILTYEQAKGICEYYGKDITELQDWEINELLNRLIDETVYCQTINFKR